jgi:hypothetical protein
VAEKISVPKVEVIGLIDQNGIGQVEITAEIIKDRTTLVKMHRDRNKRTATAVAMDKVPEILQIKVKIKVRIRVRTRTEVRIVEIMELVQIRDLKPKDQTIPGSGNRRVTDPKVESLINQDETEITGMGRAIEVKTKEVTVRVPIIIPQEVQRHQRSVNNWLRNSSTWIQKSGG